MRINEDFIDTLPDDEIIDNRLESDEESHEFQYIICFGLKTENNNYATLLEKTLSSLPYINRVSRIESNQDIKRGSGTFLTIHNGAEDFSLKTFHEVNYITVGIDADFKGNIRNTCSFLLWLYKLPKKRIQSIIAIPYIGSSSKCYNVFPQSFNDLMDFINYKSENFNSAERNPNRVSFADFMKNVAYISEQNIDDVVPYIFKRLDIVDVYVRADNRNRQESRIHDELRQIVKSGDALKKYTADLSVLQSKYRNIVKIRFSEYDMVIDEDFWRIPYEELKFSIAYPQQVSMSMSSIGVKKNTNLCESYIEMAVFYEIINRKVFMLVVIVKDTKTFMKLLKDIIPDVSDDELLAIKNEIRRLR